MALSAPHRELERGPAGAPWGEGWTVATAAKVVPIDPELVGHMMRDTPGWALWDPGIVQVEHRMGEAGEPGMVCRLAVGIRWIPTDVVQTMIGSSDDTTVFAGGGHRWRFIEVIRHRPHGRHATAIQREVEIHLCGRRRWLRSLVRAYAARHLRRSLAALS